MIFKYYNLKLFFILFLYYCYKNKKNINSINKYDKYSIDINYIKSLKKVVYTALIGKYDDISTINIEKGYDYFIFTDQIPENKKTNWTILNIEKNINFSNKLEVLKLQRFYKTHPHIYFENYDLSIYVDTTFEIFGNLDNFLLRILSPNKCIYSLEHPNRNSIYNEFGAVLFIQKETEENIKFIDKRYKKEGFPKNYGLSENCLIVRKHNDYNCINLMNLWYFEIEHYSYRDQLSFNYILWKINKSKIIKYISKNVLFEYFNQKNFHLLNFNFKNY